MPWFRIDDGWHSHPKVLELSLAAAGLWAKCGSWSASHLTDGKVTLAALRSMGGSLKLAGELVAAGLWTDVEGSFQFHQWHERQPTRVDVEKERRQKTDRQRRWRENNPTKDAPVDASTGALVDAPKDGGVEPAPARAFSRPVPSRPEEEREPPSAPPPPKAPRRKAKHPLPDDWVPSDEAKALAAELRLSLEREAAKFRDRNLAKGEVYADWDRAFSGWLRKAVEFGATGNAAKPETRGISHDLWRPE